MTSIRKWIRRAARAFAAFVLGDEEVQLAERLLDSHGQGALADELRELVQCDNLFMVLVLRCHDYTPK